LASWLQIYRLWPQHIPAPLAVLYDKVAAPGLSRFHRQIAREIASAVAGGTVLDIGTGPGHLLVEIARSAPELKLVGFDLSRKMLSMAKAVIEQDTGRMVSTVDADASANAERTDSDSIRLIHGDVRNLPFADGAFDLVVSTLSMHHWHDPSEGIRQCSRIIAPGGRCWIYDLRTDVWPGNYKSLLTGGRIASTIRSWIFKFHGVKPRHYKPSAIASWLGGGVTVRVDVHPAYLKLIIEKPHHALENHPAASSISTPSKSPSTLALS